MKRIAMFTYGYLVGSYQMELVKALAEKSIHIDFIYGDYLPLDYGGAPPALIDIQNYSGLSNIRCEELQAPSGPPRAREECHGYLASICASFTKKYPERYDAFIGVEKIGLAVAAILCSKLRTPYFYWSLEIYGPGSTGWIRQTPFHDFWLQMEYAAKKSAIATIIQDEDRANALDAMTGHTGLNLYLPVTVEKSAVQPQGGYFMHDLCEIPRERKILLLFGGNLMPPPWVWKVAVSLPEPWTLVIHNPFGTPVPDNGLPYLKLVNSSTRLPENDIPRAIASADIGFVHYAPIDSNNALTAMASAKTARYLAAGIPIIAYTGTTNLHRIFDKFPCGLAYSEPEQVGHAIRAMEKNKNMFKNMAKKAGEMFLFENASHQLMDFFDKFLKSNKD
jgi:glycosyltransferase involved in cell wall biosynthesis